VWIDDQHSGMSNGRKAIFNVAAGMTAVHVQRGPLRLGLAQMSHSRLSSPWLSDDVAHALAAMCPPLKTTDVAQAADKLTARNKATYVTDYLLGQGPI
jgi:hypothetical protein